MRSGGPTTLDTGEDSDSANDPDGTSRSNSDTGDGRLDFALVIERWDEPELQIWLAN